MFQTFRNAWKIPELKSRLLFTLGILIVYRLGSAIPVPFVSGDALTAMFANGSMLTYLDMMSGGALSRCTIFALGVTPYINASIIVQLLCVAIPYLENLAKESDGQTKIRQITRYVGGGIALVLSIGYYFLVRNTTLAAFVSVGLLGVVPGILQGLGLLFHPVFERVRQLMPTVMLEKLPNTAFQMDYVGLCWLVGIGLLILSVVVGMAAFQKKEIR